MMTDDEKTVRVRVAVVLDSDGFWAAYGSSNVSDETAEANCVIIERAFDGLDSERTVWIEADVPLPLPVAPTVEAEVQS